MTERRPWVVVPVFNALADLRVCLASLARCLSPRDRILIADDASTDPQLGEELARFRELFPAQIEIVRRRENLGFIGNVNRAFRETAPEDVVLLNSDTMVTSGWLDRMIECARSDCRIATVTPWSNNAEICSFPHFCRVNPAPGIEFAERIAAAAAASNCMESPELPTAVGFAMFLRRQALQEVGDFDAATFGRGYGEENDFCLRAAAHGWKNVLCPRAYVVHTGGASFKAVGLAPGGDNLARLLARYPHYNAMVHQFITTDPLRPLRERLASALSV